MLPRETRRQIVTAATQAAILTAAADYASGRRADSLTQADRAIVGDLGRRVAGRSPVVQAAAPRDQEQAASLFAAAFSRSYAGHLDDLVRGHGTALRDVDQLAHDVLIALESTR